MLTKQLQIANLQDLARRMLEASESLVQKPSHFVHLCMEVRYTLGIVSINKCIPEEHSNIFMDTKMHSLQ